MLDPFATASRAARRITIHQVSLVSRRTPPAHRCPRRRQRVTEGTAMAPWNGPNEAIFHTAGHGDDYDDCMEQCRLRIAAVMAQLGEQITEQRCTLGPPK